MDERLKHISWQARSALGRYDLLDLNALSEMTFNQMLRLERVGRKITNEIQDVLHQHGMSYRSANEEILENSYLQQRSTEEREAT